MWKRAILAILLSSLLAPVLGAQGTEGDMDELWLKGNDGPCSTHASLLLEACSADKRDDYLVHLADCAYVTSNDDRKSCTAAARAERREKAEECEEVYEARLDICDIVGE